jgi:hypothetical protein
VAAAELERIDGVGGLTGGGVDEELCGGGVGGEGAGEQGKVGLVGAVGRVVATVSADLPYRRRRWCHEEEAKDDEQDARHGRPQNCSFSLVSCIPFAHLFVCSYSSSLWKKKKKHVDAFITSV